jgi:hypothetical protein
MVFAAQEGKSASVAILIFAVQLRQTKRKGEWHESFGHRQSEQRFRSGKNAEPGDACSNGQVQRGAG